MVKRRRPNKTKAPITLHIVGSSDDDASNTDSLISEMFRGMMSKHRSCWRHGFASLITRKEKERPTLSAIKELHKMSPCLLNFPRRERSKTKGRREEITKLKPRKRVKLVVSRNKGKLDSGDFYDFFENIWKSFSKDKRTSFTYLPCFYFELYLKPKYKDQVLGWIKKKPIFSKNCVIVPIVCWNHWNLLILCHFGESVQSETQKSCMVLLNSLENADLRRYEPDIRREHLLQKKTSQVPQQRDDVECGYFVLYFTKLFMEDAPENFSTKATHTS